MNAAEHDVAALGARRFLGKFVGIATDIGKLDHFIALVMMSQHDHFFTERLLGRPNSPVHRPVRKDEIILQTANFCSGCHVVSLSAPSTRIRDMRSFGSSWNGDVESHQRLS